MQRKQMETTLVKSDRNKVLVLHGSHGTMMSADDLEKLILPHEINVHILVCLTNQHTKLMSLKSTHGIGTC